MDDKTEEIEEITFSSYSQKAENFWENTKDHDVNQNYNAFLEPLTIKKVWISLILAAALAEIYSIAKLNQKNYFIEKNSMLSLLIIHLGIHT